MDVWRVLSPTGKREWAHLSISLSLYAIIRDWGLDEEFSGAQKKMRGARREREAGGAAEQGRECVSVHVPVREGERERVRVCVRERGSARISKITVCCGRPYTRPTPNCPRIWDARRHHIFSWDNGTRVFLQFEMEQWRMSYHLVLQRQLGPMVFTLYHSNSIGLWVHFANSSFILYCFVYCSIQVLHI